MQLWLIMGVNLDTAYREFVWPQKSRKYNTMQSLLTEVWQCMEKWRLL